MNTRFFGWGLLSLSLGLVLMTVPSAHSLADTRATEDAESIIKRPDGRFDVKCNDGSREIVSPQQLQTGEVCLNGSSAGRFQIQCEGSSSMVYPVRAKDGFRFGSFMTGDECLQVARAAMRDVVCAQLGTGNWYVTRINDGKRLGRPVDFESCLDASYYSRQGITCTPFTSTDWRPTKVLTNETIGFDSTFDECMRILKTTREGVTCASMGNLSWAVYRIEDKRKLGSSSDLAECSQATDEAWLGKVCVNRGGTRWQGIEIGTETSMTDLLPLGACITHL